MTIHCPAKINVFLDVTKKYKNNFHRIESIFFETNLKDELICSKNSSQECIVRDTTNFIDSKSNLINKAYEVFFDYTKIKKIGLDIELKKNIPLGGGLGGGSSDAAGILKILNRYCNTHFSSQKLKEIAKHIGADVPYFIDGGTQKITGFGEITRNINNPQIHFYSLMVFPETKIPTPFAYQCLDEDKLIFNSYENQTKLKMMIKAIKTGNYNLFISSLYNKFEKSIFIRFSELQTIKNDILKSGADGALMSGSGSTIIGFFNSCKKMKKSIEILEKKGYKLITFETQL